MKTKIFMTATIIAASLITGCSFNKNPDYKITVEPMVYNSAPAPGEMKKAVEVITKRLDHFFKIPAKNIITETGDGTITFTIHNIDTGIIFQVNRAITDNGRLEFYETWENSEIIDCLMKADSLLRDMQAGNAEATTGDEPAKDNPLLGILYPMINNLGEPLPSCLAGLAKAGDTSQVNTYLEMDRIKELFPKDIRFFWSANPYRYDPSLSLYELHAIKTDPVSEKAPLDGSVITSAEVVNNASDFDVRIGLSMDSEGAAAWSCITRKNTDRCIALVFDGNVISYPRVLTEIKGGNTEISGNFTLTEANDFVNILKSGQLPFKLKITETQVIKNN
ncbi:MAG TPA: hypothetical protein PLV06_14170 [Bacteroidales bacterium]|nr:hypothetical protein [Bacteroidales bacterium]HPF03851.1 hypothetical protein [Bacteroidales bacterium]HPJ60663.1 hypothetical protein [Bacteroidales bacterium]HPR13530.1 hypothetical protein [Bacteroidales bacterium]HRW85218.1 hypothetical protein [Bacteroidales bacterium]